MQGGGVFANSIITAILVFLIVSVLVGCSYGYPGIPGFPGYWPSDNQMDPGDVASAINIPGIVNDLKSADRPDGMSIVWENGSQAKGLRAKSTEGTIIAAVTLGGYSGEGLNKGLGIESISGILRIAFDAMVEPLPIVTSPSIVAFA